MEGRPYIVLMAYRSTPHTTTGLTASFALNKREMRTKLPVLEEKDVGEGNLVSKMKDKDAKKKEESKRYADKARNAKVSDIKEGDMVLLKQQKINKFLTRFGHKPFKVIKRKGNSVTLQTARGNYFNRNIAHVRKFSGDYDFNCAPETSESDYDSDDSEINVRPGNIIQGHAVPQPNDPAVQRDEPVELRVQPARARHRPQYLELRIP